MMKKLLTSLCPATWVKLVARLKADQAGNVLMIMGFAIIPLTFTVGFGVDYARAMRLQTQLNAAADSAALAAVAPAMILQSSSESTSAARKMFDAQAARLSGYQDLVMTPVIVDGTSGSGGSLGYLRKATVSYTVKSINQFGGILGSTTLTVTGSASASAQQPPNVDFYLAMDNSPSMLLPATSDGVSKIIAATKTSENSNGCAFACHAQVPHSDNIYIKDKQSRHILLSTGYYTSSSSNKNVYYRWDQSAKRLYNSSGNPMNTSTTSSSGVITTVTYSLPDWNKTNGAIVIQRTTKIGSGTATTIDFDTGYWADGYWLTHNYGLIYNTPSSITLRKDDVVSAASQLIPFATNQAAQYQVTYRAQMFSFDWTRVGGSTPVRTLNSLTSVASYGSGFSAASLFPADDYWWKNSQPTNGTNNNDQSTEMTNMLIAMKNTIPSAGSGAPGQTPQKILFIISDGMLDQPSGGGRYFGPLRASDLTECTAIKAKGIKIAILYTQYLPESLVGDSWSQTNIAPFLPAAPSPYPRGNAGSSDQVLTALQSCASPGTNGSPLVQAVTADDDITTALQQLFSTALQTARLVQ